MQARRRRLVLGGAGLVLAALLAAVWLVPGLLDWNRYRDGIAALATQQLGRPVHIGGGVSLQLLPQPILTANDVSVEGGLADEHGQAIGADAVGLHARALRLRVALGPLLAGKVDARELTLQGADLRLPWPPPPGALAQRPPSWLTGLQARVEDGRVQVGELVFTGIDGTVTTDPDTGTLAASGVLQAGERRWQFTTRLGRPGRDGSAGFDMSLDGQDKLRDTGGTFSGQIGADGALAGRVAGRGPDLSQLMPAPGLPWRGDGRLNAAGGLAVADELALEIGGAPARGAVALRVQPKAELDIAITAGRLDLDAWLPALLDRKSGTLRPGIPTGIDLSAEAATLAGGNLRHLRGGVDVAAGVVQLRDVTAILPGDAQLALSGQVGTQPQTRFDGEIKLSAPDLQGTLRWLQRFLPAAVTGLPPGVLRAADVSGQVMADAGQAAVTGLQGMVDGSKIEGSGTLHFGARPALTAALTIDQLVLDPWLPDPAVLGRGATVNAALAAFRALDADLKLQAGQASWRGTPLGAVAVEVQTEAARVALRRLEAHPLGGRLSVSGQVGEGGRVSDGRIDVSAADLEQLHPLLTDVLPALREWEALLQGPGSLLVLAAGPLDALAGRVMLELGDLRLEAQPVVNVRAPRWAGPLMLHHPGAPRLLEALGMAGTAAWLGDGSLSLVGQVDLMPGRWELEQGTLAAGLLRATGRVIAEGRRVFGRVSAELLPLPSLGPRSPNPLPVGSLRGWQAALRIEAAEVLVGLMPVVEAVAADVTLQNGTLTLARTTAKLRGGTLTADATLDAAADPPLVSVRAQLSGLPLAGPLLEGPVDVVAGRLEGAGELAAAGYSPAALVATMRGQAALRVQDGLASGFDLTGTGDALALADPGQALDAARAALLAGNTSFGTLDVPLTIERGVVEMDAALASVAGEARLAGSIDLQSSGLDLRLTLKPAARPATGAEAAPPGIAPETPMRERPSLGERLSGQAGAPVRTPELAGVARWLADRP